MKAFPIFPKPQSPTNRKRSIITILITMLMVIPMFLSLVLFTPMASVSADSNEDLVYWPQFQKDAGKSGTLVEELRGINDPVINWDLEYNVISMGSTSADFTGNGLGSGYDRDVWHLLFSAENEDGNMTIFIVDGETGESMWELDMGDTVVEAGPVVGHINDSPELEIVFATSEGIVYAYTPDIDYDPDQGEGDRYTWDESNKDRDKIWEYETEDEILDVSPILTDLSPEGGDDTLDVVITTRYSDTHSKIYALEGDTDSGSKLWEKELEGELPSSVSSLIDGSTNYLWVSCYSSDNEEQYLYGIEGIDGEMWKTVDEDATRGYWDMFIPSPTIADVDGDDDLDIVLAVPMDPDNSNEYGTIYVYNLYGEPLDDWRYGVPIKGRISATPVVGDLRGDGKAYVVIQAWYFSGTTDASTVVTALKRDATKLWTREFNTDSDTLEDRAVSSPVLYDLDADGSQDVIAATNPRVYAFNGSHGSFMDGFIPGRRVNDDIHQLYDSPAIGDFNRDGIFDIFIDSVLITHEIAELEVRDIEFTPENPEAGTEITIKATVFNVGTKDTADVPIQFYDGDELIQETYHKILAGGQADKIPRVENYLITEGSHTFRVIVDPESEIEEVNKTNNMFTKAIFAAAPYDFKLATPMDEKVTMPDTTVSFRVEVENMGTRDDSYAFISSGLPVDWDVTISGPLEPDDTLYLESRNSENITIEIDVPNAKAHVRETLTLNVTSENSEIEDHINLTIEVLQDYDVLMVVEGASTKKVSPGGEIEFPLLIENTGNGEDSYTIEREGSLPDSWESRITPSSFSKVDSDRKRDCTITLKAPDIGDLDGNNLIAEVTILIQSSVNDSVEERVVITAEIAQLVISNNTKYAFPGENATYLIEIFNKDSVENNVRLSLPFGYNGWSASFDDDYFPIAANSKVERILTVTVPDDEEPWSDNPITVEAEFEEQGESEFANQTTIARQKFEVEITSLSNETEENITSDMLEPGQSANYSLEIHNLGNYYDNFTFEAEIPDGWTIEFSPMDVPLLVKNGTETIEIILTTSTNEKAYSQHQVTLRVYSIDNKTAFDTVTLNITILRTRGVNVEVNLSSLSLLPDEEKRIQVIVTNTGNWYENFSLTLTPPPGMDNFSMVLDQLEYAYVPFEIMNFSLSITAPGPLDIQAFAGSSYQITIDVDSSDRILNSDVSTDLTIDQYFKGEVIGASDVYIKPDDLVEFEMTLTNLGNGFDDFTILSDLNEDNWTITFIIDTIEWESFIRELAPGYSITFTVRAISPEVGIDESKAGFVARAAVGAISENGEGFVQQFNMTVEQIFSTRIFVEHNDLRIIPEESVNYTITIINTGNGDDEITLGFNETPTYWELLVVGGRTFSLAYAEQKERTVKISSPGIEDDPKFGAMAIINVIGASTRGPMHPSTVNASLRTMLSYIMPSANYFLIAPDSEKEIPYYIMDVEGGGNEYELDGSINTPWKVRFSNNKDNFDVSLKDHERETIYVTIHAPSQENTLAGDRITATIGVKRGTLNEDPFVNITLEVKGVFEFTVEPINTNISVDQGSHGNFSFTITNTGNAVDIYTFRSANLLEGWTSLFTGLKSIDVDGQTSHFISLDARDQHIFHLEITLPEYAEARNFTIQIGVLSDHGENKIVDVYAIVKPFYQMEIHGESESYLTNDGETLRIDLLLNNTGNVKDNVTMQVLKLPGTWSHYYSPSTFTFTAQSAKSVTLTIIIPLGEATADHDITVRALSLDGGNIYDEDLTIQVRLQDKPDLVVSSITFSASDPEEGDSVTITAEIDNDGSAVARSIIVHFYLDGDLLGEDSISTISSSLSGQATYEWKVVEGTHEISVIVDPADNINEIDDTNNEGSETITVAEASESSNWNVIVILLVVILGGVVFFINRSRSEEEDEPRKRKSGSRGTKKTREKEVDYSAGKKKVLDSDTESDDWTQDDDVKKVLAAAKGKSAKSKPKPKISMEEEIFPVILNCPNCRSKIRIVKEGKFRCPNCKHIGTVDETGEIKKGNRPKIMTESEERSERADPHYYEESISSKESPSTSSTSTSVIRTRDSLFPLKYVCVDCSKKSTVEKEGWYKCPFCGSVHHVDEDGDLDNIPEEDEEESFEKSQKQDTQKGPSWKDQFRPTVAEDSRITRRNIPRNKTTSDWDENRTSRSSRAGKPQSSSDDTDTNSNIDTEEGLAPDRVTSYPAVVACPSCESRVRVQKQGTYKCPECEERFTVGGTSEITVNCPWCDVTVKVRKSGNYNCPTCAKRLHITKDGSSGILLEKPTKKALKENSKKELSLESLPTVFAKFIPELEPADIKLIHENGYRTLTALKEAEDIDLALVGLPAEKAKYLRDQMKKF